MADHWNNASFVVPLSAEQQVWAMTALKRRESYEGDDDENPHNMHPSEGVCDLDIEPLSDGSGLVVVGDVSIEPLCDWLVSIMRQFSIAGAWTFEASYDCTKPRVDAFGGCACIITKDNIEMMSTDDWLDRRLTELGLSSPQHQP